MKIKISALGQLSTYIKELIEVEIEHDTDLQSVIYNIVNIPAKEKIILCSVNGKMQRLAYILNDGDKVVLFKPVGGG